jgi:hypothetical protein
MARKGVDDLAEQFSRGPVEASPQPLLLVVRRLHDAGMPVSTAQPVVRSRGQADASLGG